MEPRRRTGAGLLLAALLLLGGPPAVGQAGDSVQMEITVVTVIMGFIVGGIAISLPTPTEWWQWVLSLAALVVVGVFAVTVMAIVLRMKELSWALGFTKGH